MFKTKNIILPVVIFIGICFYACKKDNALTSSDISTVNLKVYDDDSITLPIEVIAGNGCLLSAYSTSSGILKFNLTDNNGKLIWQKQFGISTIRGMLKEQDGTFTVFSGNRLINFNQEGVVLKDDLNFLSAVFSTSTGYNTIRACLDNNNNYLFYGSYYSAGSTYAFASVIDRSGATVFKKFYDLSSVFTGCEFTNDGGYLFYGNNFANLVNISTTMYILKANSAGIMQWKKNYLLWGNAFAGLPVSTGEYGFDTKEVTHEIIQISDSNYLCFVNNPNGFNSDQRARIYKINSTGDLLDSTYIQFANYNRFTGGGSNSYSSAWNLNVTANGYSSVKNQDGSLTVFMQSGFLGSYGLTNSFGNACNSFYFTIDDNLNVTKMRFIQNSYIDCFTSVCKSSDGHTVAFGMISSFGADYKPVLYFSDTN